MTVLKASDVDKAMGRHIDPTSVPLHNGADQGVMEGHFAPQSDQVIMSHQAEHRGAPVYMGRELPPDGTFGSATVVSVNDAPPLDSKFEPKPVAVPVARPPAPPQLKPAAAPAAPVAPRMLHPLLQRPPLAAQQLPAAPPPPAPPAPAQAALVAAAAPPGPPRILRAPVALPPVAPSIPAASPKMSPQQALLVSMGLKRAP